MGRRAGTNSSPIDSAMERYYNDVGSRLSGVVIPTFKADKTLAEDFCMLTIDPRRYNCRLATPATTHKSQISSHRSQRSATSSGVSSSSSSHSGNDNVPKGKMRLVDKLTRALFQKKHMCSRCKKRSRTCLPNKTFTHTEKHYTCASCREQTQAVRTLFKQHDHTTPTDPAPAVLTPQNQERLMPQKRSQNIDSGYDTATSCSTLASAFSAFNSPVNTVKSAARAKTLKEDLVWERTSQNGNGDTCPTPQNHCDTALDANNLRTVPQCSGQMFEFMKAVHAQTSGVQRQEVRPVLVHNYDGYLPEVDFQNLDKYDVIIAAPSPVTLEGQTVGGDLSGNAGPARSSLSGKVCHICGSAEKPSFRLPMVGGWVCEDCLDVLH